MGREEILRNRISILRDDNRKLREEIRSKQKKINDLYDTIDYLKGIKKDCDRCEIYQDMKRIREISEDY